MSEKQYLKMADAFAHDSVEALEQHIYAGHMSKQACEYAAHATSSHDELVAENERLRELLSECYPYIKDASDWGGEYDNDLKSRVFDECGVSHDQATSRGGVCQLLSVVSLSRPGAA